MSRYLPIAGGFDNIDACAREGGDIGFIFVAQKLAELISTPEAMENWHEFSCTDFF